MSEYWKSTPKYWCKHCNTFVKDTPFERRQHESTAKHQGNLKRFLRGIQNDHERNEREKEKVKAEVERLNKVVGSSSSSTPPATKQVTTKKTAAGPLSAADQKKQWAQLAEMGISVPGGFMADMAIPGEWQKIAERPVEELIKGEALSTGVRKRKHEGEEEEEEAGETVARRGWGSTTRRYPGEAQSDLDALLSKPVVKKEKIPTGEIKPEQSHKDEMPPKEHSSMIQIDSDLHEDVSQNHSTTPGKLEVMCRGNQVKNELEESNLSSLLSVEPESTDAPVFKKRKAKGK